MPSKIAVHEDDGLRAADFTRPIVILKIDGLHPRHEEYGSFALELDKAPAQIDYSEIHASLIHQGVDGETADLAVEKMARFIEIQSLARILAERIKVQP